MTLLIVHTSSKQCKKFLERDPYLDERRETVDTFSAYSAVLFALRGRPLYPFETRKHNFYAMFGLLLRADQETTKRAIIFGMRGVAGLARNALGDG